MTTPAVAPADALVARSWGFLADRALQAAAEIGIADHLAAGPVPLGDLAAATGSVPDALERMLRPLVATGFLERDESGAYARTEWSALLESDRPDSLRPWFRLMYRLVYRSLDDPLVTLRTGRPSFESRFGTSFFDHLAHHPEDSAVFNAAMAGLTHRTARAVAAVHDFTDAGLIADIGGGLGTLVAEILTRRPGARGIVLDRPQVTGAAREALDAAGVGERVDVVAGDFFRAVPAADTYLLSWILHDWDDERALAILRQCRTAQRGGERGRLLVVEAVLPERPAPEPVPADRLDLLMLFVAGGRERTEAQYARLFEAAGYRHTGTVALEAPGMHLIEARPV
ncbi:methyltransferase [Streptomyces yaizuensis]|uniref:Methyltransferase n=1 Tax=Streptomyces yaizuensis TaxID=2989713 RepID=A0ABQ5P326_9ACTN|nr:methyltransferase [Streptomyces sp. YSPA8]GLF96890.1 methyltransferase [Streptomyces sp. YSPA8]